MRIAILTSSYPRYTGDGAAPFVKSMAEALARRHHSVEVVVPYDAQVKPSQTGIVPVHRFRYWLINNQQIMGHGRALEGDVRLKPLAYVLLPFYLLAAFFSLWRVTGKQESEAIHVHWVLPNGPIAALVARWRKIALVVSLHGSDMFIAGKNRWFGALAGWVLKHADAVTACSQELKERAIALGAPASTELIAWGADPGIFRPAEDRRAVRQKYNWGEGLIIVALGRLVYKKGFDILLKALPSIIVDHPQVKTIIGGDGPILADLKALVSKLGIENSVCFIGQVPWNEVPDLFAAADIFVLPSVKDISGNLDGLPTVLLEAMSCGCAVVASNIGGTSLVIRDRENGILVTPGSECELARALGILLNQPALREKLGAAARSSVVSQLNWEEVAYKIERLLTSPQRKKSVDHRMGTIYRDEMMASLDLLSPAQGPVLDIGCYDGLLLNQLQATFRVGVDLHPGRNFPGINMVQADARHLPFRSGCFERIYALDVIEHIEDDISFAKSLINVARPGGKVILTTPSASIRLYPPFLTAWISRNWGHIYRLGYTPDMLHTLFDKSLEMKIQSWNAPLYRFFYLPLRILQIIFPKIVKNFVRQISRLDAKKQEGKRGFLVMLAMRKVNSAPN